MRSLKYSIQYKYLQTYSREVNIDNILKGTVEEISLNDVFIFLKISFSPFCSRNVFLGIYSLIWGKDLFADLGKIKEFLGNK